MASTAPAMAKAGYCAECGENVWLADDGGCSKGHPATSVSGVYEAPLPQQGMSAESPVVRHDLPKCQACGHVGEWKVERLFLVRHWVIAGIFLFAFGGGLIYLAIVAIIRSGKGSRAKICRNCGGRNLFTFVY